jgi:hypothetical protein
MSWEIIRIDLKSCVLKIQYSHDMLITLKEMNNTIRGMHILNGYQLGSTTHANSGSISTMCNIG